MGQANDIDKIEAALQVFQRTTGRPTFIILDSHIGYGAPHKQDTAEAHGEPLGEDEVRLAKRSYGWPQDAKFLVPDEVREHFSSWLGARGAKARSRWKHLLASYAGKYPKLAHEIYLMQHRELPAGWDDNLPVFAADPKGIAGREASGKVLNVLAQNIPWFLGALQISVRRTRPLSSSTEQGISKQIIPAGGTCILVSANTQWRQS
jgi:transketolase